MSTFMNFIINKDKKITFLQISSGGLKSLYNPKIFDGNEEAIESFTSSTYLDDKPSNQVTLEKLKELVFFVIMDFDKKIVISYQPARNIQAISSSFDSSWTHIKDWQQRNELGHGLYDYSVNQVTIPFPKEKYFAASFLESNQKKLPMRNGEIYIDDNFSFLTLQIHPKDWQFFEYKTLSIEQYERLVKNYIL